MRSRRNYSRSNTLFFEPELNRRTRTAHHTPHDSHEDNVWYQSMHTLTKALTNESCYVCSVWPHAVRGGSVLLPVPVAANVTIFTLLKWTTRGMNMSNFPWLGQHSLSFRNVSTLTLKQNQTVVAQSVIKKLRKETHPIKDPELCFHSPVTNYTLHRLGYASGCKLTLNVSCGVHNCNNRTDPYTDPTGGSESPIPNVVKMNLTKLLGSTPLYSFNSTDNSSSPVEATIILIPSDLGYSTPTTMMWTCGRRSYLFLPAGWSGTCYLSLLTPNIYKVENVSTHVTRHRTKREYISPGKKAAMALVPLYGPVALAHYIDQLAVDLENLTALTEQGFSAMSNELKALRAVSLQNRMALDMVLAEKGGVCQLIGDQCCTYVPDASENMTEIETQLDQLRDKLHKANKKNEWTWDWWGWLTSGGWTNMLKKAAIFLIGIVALLFCLTCCVLPCLRAMTNRLVQQAASLYLIQTPYAEMTSEEDENDDATLGLPDLFPDPGDYRSTIV